MLGRPVLIACKYTMAKLGAAWARRAVFRNHVTLTEGVTSDVRRSHYFVQTTDTPAVEGSPNGDPDCSLLAGVDRKLKKREGRKGSACDWIASGVGSTHCHLSHTTVGTIS